VAKKAAKDAAPETAEPRVRLSAHPRAKRHIAAAKGWGGIAGFAVVLFFSIQGGTPPPDAMLRGLVGGIGFSMLGWAAAVAVWRQLAVAEVHAARKRMERLAEMVAAEAAERAAAADAEAKAAA
jgi:uncharacterized membrane protein YccC